MTADRPAGAAVLSPCGQYRYRLDRTIASTGPVAAIIGVNPSTADAEVDDQTIRKDMGFARRLGWGRIIKGNLFAHRATDIKALRRAQNPTGPENDRYLAEIMREADVVVAAWGPCAKLPPHLRGRWKAIARIADEVSKPLMCWGTAQDGQPRHPLMLAYETPLVPWSRP